MKQPDPERIMHLGLGFWGSKTLLSAIELGVFTELSKEALGLNPHSPYGAQKLLPLIYVTLYN